MAQASHKKFGAGQQDQGKGDGSGGMNPAEPDSPLRAEILSNRDTSRHSEQRGLDSRHVQTEQLHDHVGSQPAADAAEPDRAEQDKLADELPHGAGSEHTGQEQARSREAGRDKE